MSAGKSHKKEYFIVFGMLTLLTVLELMIPEYVTHYGLKASSLTALAIGKAFLVAYFFMHLKQETRWLKFIAAIPISAAFFAAMVVIESVVR